jgi:hypothetical protein
MPTDALAYPLGPATISGTTYTVDFLLESPRRVTQVIANLALQRFYVDRIFASAGTITGGSVVYDQATANDLYATRDVQRVEPGKEFPVVTFDRGVPLTAQVEKFGGKFFVTDEARRRNDVARINRALVRLANTIVRKIQQRALAELQASITANSRTAVGVSWTTAMGTAPTALAPGSGPGRDFARIQRSAIDQELGYTYDFAGRRATPWPRCASTASTTCGSRPARRQARSTSCRSVRSESSATRSRSTRRPGETSGTSRTGTSPRSTRSST